MKSISLTTATTLLGQSERTLRRRIADGILPRVTDQQGSSRTMIPFDAIKDQIVIPLDHDELDLLEQADLGDAEAQNCIALIFLANAKAESAIYWLELAAKQEHPDAMHWLARCYIDGKGIMKDENLGMMWLAKAAANGHTISEVQMQSIRNSLVLRD